MFEERLQREFPNLLPEGSLTTDPVARRAFLKLLGGSLALAGATACTRQPPEKIVPYVRQPEDLVPGRPLYFATSMAIGGAATGLLVESHEGRPTKIEGNPQHPSSLGASDVFAQAAILDLYDPGRSQTLTNAGEIRPWSAFLGAMRSAVTAQQPLGGSGIRILTESVSSPTLAAQLRELLARFPAAKWHQWDPAAPDRARAGARLAFGEYLTPLYHFDRADVVVALDSDFLTCGPGSLRYAREFATRRRPDDPARMSRFYSIEAMPTATGARADHRLPAKPSEVETLARAIAAAAGVQGVSAPALSGDRRKWTTAIAADLQAHRGASLVLAGDHQPAIVHALAHAINQSLGNAGRTVDYVSPPEAEPIDHLQSLTDLVADMKAGSVTLLLIAGGNPVYTAPADLDVAGALDKVALRVHLGQYDDETSALCHWHVPEAHFLEAWSDARGHDGTAGIIQPLVAPLYAGKTPHELLATLSERPERTSNDLVREYWSRNPPASATYARGQVGRPPSPDFERAWRRWLHDGVIANTAFEPKPVTVKAGFAAAPDRSPAGGGSFEIAFRNDPCVLDGRFANNGWLQELSKPITALTWDNAVCVSPNTAERLRARNTPAYTGGEHGWIDSDVVEIRYRERTVRGAIFAVPGHPDDCATVHLGYGRTRGGHLISGAGFNANAIRTADAPSYGAGAELVRTGERHPLACTQYHHLMEGRNPVRVVTRDEFARDPEVVAAIGEAPPKTLTLYPEHPYDGYKWGMAIDLNACIGCGACVVGCQAENNIPIVGKDQVLRGREMHWIRVDTYHRGTPERPETYFQPVPCMHCENAPCEPVCPVGATVHGDEGLNEMVYNRCVGTRYCSNNCPYKVRRFNFLLYQDWNTPTLKLGRNPDVTVRSRGVMEKCTYCVQRINEARIESKKADARLRDGDVVTACQQACPADAIVFGDLNDPNSRVARLQASARNYALLGELNTRPRTTYLAAVRNVNPELGD